MPSDPSRPGSASLGSRDMYSSMSGYMPNGYGGAYDTSSMYSQSPYGPSSHMGSSASPLYSRDYMSMYSPSSTTASSMSSYMNGYGSMYGSSSPYGSMAGPMSPEDGESGVVTHPGGHSPGSVKSEAGVGPGTSGSSGSVSMGSGSPLGTSSAVPPPAGSGGPPPPQATVKREPMAPSSGPPPGPGQDIYSLMSTYLPPDTMDAARAGDPQATARVQAFYGQYGHLGLSMSVPPSSHGGSESMSLPPPASAYPVV